MSDEKRAELTAMADELVDARFGDVSDADDRAAFVDLLLRVHNAAVAQCQQAVNDTGTLAPDRHLPSLVKAFNRMTAFKVST